MMFSKWKIFNRYFCNNCGHWFRTGCFLPNEENIPESKELYDDICPRCGALVDEWYQFIPYFFYKLLHKSRHKKLLEKKYRKYKKNS